jgi:dihydrofolate synthase/folylpolyglutamate synthase
VGEGTEIWLDGGHNEAGGQAIAHALAEFDERVPRAVHLVWGMMETKDAQAVIAPFKDLIERVYTVPIPEEENAFSAEALADIAAGEGFNVTAATNVPHALLLSQAAFSRPGRVLICGSLYLAGHVLKLHNAQRLTLPNVSAYRQRRSRAST